MAVVNKEIITEFIPAEGNRLNFRNGLLFHGDILVRHNCFLIVNCQDQDEFQFLYFF